MDYLFLGFLMGGVVGVTAFWLGQLSQKKFLSSSRKKK